MKPTFMAATAMAAVIGGLSASPALAHGVAGARFFPATIATDDPAVADELSLPTISYQDGETEIAGEWSKRITPRFGVSFEGAWVRDGNDTPAIKGFNNLETTLKWQFLTDGPSETIVSAGLGVEWGGSGDPDIAEATSAVTPTLYFGKGFGSGKDTPDWIRPFAVTGLISYTLPSSNRDENNDLIPQTLNGGLTVQYSLPYLTSQVRDYGWPTWVGQLTPLVEFTAQRPVRNGAGAGTTGTINPGVLWTGRRMQLGAEAIIPMNADSGDQVGWAIQAHFFLDDLFPHSLGRPLMDDAR